MFFPIIPIYAFNGDNSYSISLKCWYTTKSLGNFYLVNTYTSLETLKIHVICRVQIRYIYEIAAEMTWKVFDIFNSRQGCSFIAFTIKYSFILFLTHSWRSLIRKYIFAYAFR